MITKVKHFNKCPGKNWLLETQYRDLCSDIRRYEDKRDSVFRNVSMVSALVNGMAVHMLEYHGIAIIWFLVALGILSFRLIDFAKIRHSMKLYEITFTRLTEETNDGQVE
jgi:hypothetical protein